MKNDIEKLGQSNWSSTHKGNKMKNNEYTIEDAIRIKDNGVSINNLEIDLEEAVKKANEDESKTLKQIMIEMIEWQYDIISMQQREDYALLSKLRNEDIVKEKYSIDDIEDVFEGLELGKASQGYGEIDIQGPILEIFLDPIVEDLNYADNKKTPAKAILDSTIAQLEDIQEKIEREIEYIENKNAQYELRNV